MAFPEYVSDTIVDNTTYVFTSIEEMHLEFSRIGEIMHTDDLNESEANYDQDNEVDVIRDNYLEQLCQRATSHIMEYLGGRYDAKVLYRIPRIREIATYWALYKLTGRRGNPKLYEDEYLDAMESLEGYRDGTRFLDAPSKGQHAVIQSYIVDNRFLQRQVRVVVSGATTIKSGQRVAYMYPFPWL